MKYWLIAPCVSESIMIMKSHVNPATGQQKLIMFCILLQ